VKTTANGSVHPAALFMVGFAGTSLAPGHWLATAIREQGLGAVILFARRMDGRVQNIASPGQLAELTSRLQDLGRGRLLIAVDQEGGRVCRLRAGDGFPATRSAAELAAMDEKEARDALTIQARALADAGINWNLAPVVDLDLNPGNPVIGRWQRSFGRDPDQVVRLARLFVEVHREQGISSCLKHFPGHGSAGRDSHLGFVDVSGCWQQEELLPFARLIASGHADAVMTAHLVNRQLDPEGLPATLSGTMVRDVLRQRLGFSGLVISDDLQMRAITDGWGYEEAVRRCLRAGVDMLLVGNNLLPQEDGLERGVRVVREMLDRGGSDADCIREHLQRVRAFREQRAGGR